MPRNSFLLAGLSRGDRVVEIGPSYSPLAPKRDGWNTLTIDHASREELAAKYVEHGKDAEMIEEVDIIWRSGSLSDAVPEDLHGTFDAFIASHVIEHTPDVITFLQAAQTLIKPEGIIVLAVPDKRKCFDFYRHPSTTADAIVAFMQRRSRHDTRTHLDYGMQMALKDGLPAWNGGSTRQAALLCPLDHVSDWLSRESVDIYVDAHSWIFVPASFRLMILELGLIGYLDLRIEQWIERPDTEFLVRLRKGAEAIELDQVQDRRRELMEQVLIEIADQTRQIVGSPLHALPMIGPIPTIDTSPELRVSPRNSFWPRWWRRRNR